RRRLPRQPRVDRGRVGREPGGQKTSGRQHAGLASGLVVLDCLFVFGAVGPVRWTKPRGAGGLRFRSLIRGPGREATVSSFAAHFGQSLLLCGPARGLIGAEARKGLRGRHAATVAAAALLAGKALSLCDNFLGDGCANRRPRQGARRTPPPIV